jgi:hypothetical protein
MPTYWITAHVDEQYLVEAANEEEARTMVYDGDVSSRGDEIVGMTITYEGDNND